MKNWEKKVLALLDLYAIHELLKRPAPSTNQEIIHWMETEKMIKKSSAGTVFISETQYDLLLTPDLHGLTPGPHGFHIHQNSSCDKNGMSAGGHFDPKNTGEHLGPYNDNGHYGDLPILYVNSDGTATTPVLAPRIHSVAEISQHALMIHNAGDNYSDVPEKLGGGGARMVCGIIN